MVQAWSPPSLTVEPLAVHEGAPRVGLILTKHRNAPSYSALTFMSNRKLQIFLIHPPFAQVFGHTGSRLCPVRASGLQLPASHPIFSSSAARFPQLHVKGGASHRFQKPGRNIKSIIMSTVL